MRSMATSPDVNVPMATLRRWLAVSPQYAARKLAYQVETNGGVRPVNSYPAGMFPALVDGCRNGLLRWYYDPRP